MLSTFVLILAVVAGVCWVCLSPLRLAVAGVVMLAAYPVPVFVVTAVVAVAVALAAVRLAYRSVCADGWYLVTVHRPGFAQSRAGGVAS